MATPTRTHTCLRTLFLAFFKVQCLGLMICIKECIILSDSQLALEGKMGIGCHPSLASSRQVEA